MKFSVDWFKKTLRIGRKQESAELQGDEGEGAKSETIKSAVVEVENSDAQATVVIAGSVQDSHVSEAGSESDTTEPEQSDDSKQSLWVRWLKVFRRKKASDQTETSAADTETPHKTGMWATMTAVIMRRPKQTATTDADSEGKGESQEENKSEEEFEKPTWRQRLKAIFQRKAPAAEEEPTEESAQRKADEAAAAPEKKRKRPDDGKAEEVDEEKPVGAWGRIAAILSKKMVWIPLVFLVIVLSAFAVTMLVLDMRKQEQAKVEALEKKNRKLQEENLKLQQASKKAPPKPEEAKSQADNAPSGAKGKNDPGGVDDCTVTNKASVAEVLKRCIEGFNAADRR